MERSPHKSVCEANPPANKIVDHSDVVGAPPVGAAPTTSSFSTSPGFIGLGKDNCKTRRKSFKFGDLLHLILEILQYIWSVYWELIAGYPVRDQHDS